MEAKTGVEEKRVKATVIRRRAKAEPETPAPASSETSEKPQEAAAVAQFLVDAAPDVLLEHHPANFFPADRVGLHRPPALELPREPPEGRLPVPRDDRAPAKRVNVCSRHHHPSPAGEAASIPFVIAVTSSRRNLMTRWVLLALLPVASSCMAQQWYTTRPIPVESMPDRIVPDTARGGPKELAVDRCTSPLIDPAMALLL